MSRDHHDLVAGLVPIVIEQSNRGERSFDIYSRLLRERIIFVTGQVEDYMSAVIGPSCCSSSPKTRRKTSSCISTRRAG